MHWLVKEMCERLKCVENKSQIFIQGRLFFYRRSDGKEVMLRLQNPTVHYLVHSSAQVDLTRVSSIRSAPKFHNNLVFMSSVDCLQQKNSWRGKICPYTCFDWRTSGCFRFKFRINVMVLQATPNVPFNFLQSAVTTWLTCEVARWERHFRIALAYPP
jgi:hypothetical protein